MNTNFLGCLLHYSIQQALHRLNPYKTNAAGTDVHPIFSAAQRWNITLTYKSKPKKAFYDAAGPLSINRFT